MSPQQAVILVVDDEPMYRELIAEHLAGCGYVLLNAGNGQEALDILHQHADEISAVLLDRMMPLMDGMQLLALMKLDSSLAMIPTILQTAVSDPEQVAEGIKAGCFYYLTKPYDSEVLRSIVATAIRDYSQKRLQLDSLQGIEQAMHCLANATLSFRTREEAHHIATTLAKLSSRPQLLTMGLLELMLNAVEHGNLGITYAEKTELIAQDRLHDEVRRRLEMPAHADKQASIQFKRRQHQLEFLIKDQGRGFDWQQFLDISPQRLMDNHGRGIAMARQLSFAHLQYFGNGNTVLATHIDMEA